MQAHHVYTHHGRRRPELSFGKWQRAKKLGGRHALSTSKRSCVQLTQAGTRRGHNDTAHATRRSALFAGGGRATAVSRAGAIEHGAIREAEGSWRASTFRCTYFADSQARVVVASVRQVTHYVSQGVKPGGFVVGCFRSGCVFLREQFRGPIRYRKLADHVPQLPPLLCEETRRGARCGRDGGQAWGVWRWEGRPRKGCTGMVHNRSGHHPKTRAI